MLKTWLLTYNVLSLILWVILPVVFWTRFFEDDLLWVYALLAVQGLAFADIIHSATGATKAPLSPAISQYISRMLVSALIWWMFSGWKIGDESAVAFATMGIFTLWPAAEIIRFSLYASEGKIQQVVWLRYSAFIVLYPAGVFCESILMVRSAWEAFVQGDYLILGGLLILALAYVIYFPRLYRYMWQQRRKVLA